MRAWFRANGGWLTAAALAIAGLGPLIWYDVASVIAMHYDDELDHAVYLGDCAAAKAAFAHAHGYKGWVLKDLCHADRTAPEVAGEAAPSLAGSGRTQ